MAIAKTASRNVTFKSGKMMDALFQGQSMAQTPQSRLDPDFEGLASDAELYFIFLIRTIARSSLVFILVISCLMLCRIIS